MISTELYKRLQPFIKMLDKRIYLLPEQYIHSTILTLILWI